MNFLITGYPYSGLEYLHNILSRSKEWEVKHKPRADFDIIRAGNKMHGRLISRDFSEPYYGEVNPGLRYWYKDLIVAKKAIVVRDPFDVFLEEANALPNHRHREAIKGMERWYRELAELSRKDTPIRFIQYDILKHSPNFAETIAKWLGVHDLQDFSYIKKGKDRIRRVKFATFMDIPRDTQAMCVERMGRFREEIADIPWKF